MQVVMNKSFPKLWKKLAQIHLIVFKKHKNRLTPTHSNSKKNDVTKPKARMLDYSN